jgi:hypothetical protein
VSDELGPVLVLMQGASERWSTVRLVCRSWCDEAGRAAAFARYREQLASSATAFGVLGSPDVRPSETLREYAAWVGRPDYRRIEHRLDPHRAGHVIVVNGSRWWMHDPAKGTLTNDGDPRSGVGTGDFDALLDPSTLLPAHRFTVLGPIEVDGRAAIEVLAEPRPTTSPHLSPGQLPGGADEHRLAVDLQRGVLLRVESRLNGAAFFRQELLDLAFDEPLPEDLFDGTRLPGPVASTATRHQHQRTTVADAAARAPFTVLVPTPAPPGTVASAMVIEPDEWGAGHHAVSIIYRDDEHATQISVHETAAEHESGDGLDWTTRIIGGRTIEVCDVGTMVIAKTTHEGTSVRIQGNVALDQVAALAASLEPEA